jgi:hypothetical protein
MAQAVCGESRTYGLKGGKTWESLPIPITGLCEFVRRCIEADACPVLQD